MTTPVPPVVFTVKWRDCRALIASVARIPMISSGIVTVVPSMSRSYPLSWAFCARSSCIAASSPDPTAFAVEFAPVPDVCPLAAVVMSTAGWNTRSPVSASVNTMPYSVPFVVVSVIGV